MIWMGLQRPSASEVIGGCLRQGLQVESIEGHGHEILTVLETFADFEKKPAMCCTLVARKAR